MAKKYQKKIGKSEKSGKITVKLDETHQNITKKKNAKKVIFMAREGRKGAKKRVKKKAIWGHFLLGKMAYLL